MTTTLSEGVKVPDVGSVNWAGDLEVNWNLLNGALANLSGNVKLDRDNTWTGEQSFTLPIVGSITGTASKAIADEDGTSIKTGYVNVAGNQTVTGNKDWTGINRFVGLTIKDSVALANGDYGQALTYRDNQDNRHAYIQPYKNTSGVVNLAIGVDNSGSVQLNSSLIPYATNVISLGSSSYQWSSVYAQTYYYNGTAWGLDKSNTWSASNTFNVTDYHLSGSYYRNTSFSGKLTPETTQAIAVATVANSDTWYGNQVYICDANGECYWRWNCGSFHGTSQGQGVWGIDYGVTRDFSQPFFRPQFNNSCNLGTSTNKWKTLNGINPGALSLPSATYTGATAIVEIDRTGWVYDGTGNSYSPPVDCWLSISNGGSISVWGANTAFGMKATDNIAIPLRLGETYSVSLTHIPDFCRIYPCLGNV